MGRDKHDFEGARTQFLEGQSLRQISESLGIPLTSLHRRSKSEDWPGQVEAIEDEEPQASECTPEDLCLEDEEGDDELGAEAIERDDGSDEQRELERVTCLIDEDFFEDGFAIL